MTRMPHPVLCPVYAPYAPSMVANGSLTVLSRQKTSRKRQVERGESSSGVEMWGRLFSEGNGECRI